MRPDQHLTGRSIFKVFNLIILNEYAILSLITYGLELLVYS